MENLKEQIEGIVYGYSAEEATERILKLIEDNYVRKELPCHHKWTKNIIPNILNEEQCIKCGEIRKP